MPAVQLFALYAGVSLLVNFFLQMTCFLALFILDTRRQEVSFHIFFIVFKHKEKLFKNIICQNVGNATNFKH